MNNINDDKSYVIHKHCNNCFFQKCIDSFSKVCQMTPCRYNCGAIFHQCKEQDHFIICAYNIQFCTNSGYGCPFKLHKNKINTHLNVCPASTVICTMEWNRKPLHIQNTMHMTGYNPNVTVLNQIEVSLALRDQRVLLEAIASPEILSSFFQCNIGSQNSSAISTDISKNSEEIGNTKNNHSKDEASFKTDLEKNAISKLSVTQNLEKDLVIKEKESKPVKKPLLRSKFRLAPKIDFKDTWCNTSDDNIDFTNLKWLNPSLQPKGLDPVTSMFEMLGAYEKQNSISNSHHIEGLRCTLSDTRLCSFRHIATQTRPAFDIRKLTDSIGNAFQEAFDQNLNQLYLSANHHPKLYESLALNQIMECLPRYDHKSVSVYSFMCNTLFRRDQFQTHFENVHCDIFSNLNGWLEEKCPYAQYGCNFSQFRFFPNVSPNSVVFDNSRGCIALRPCNFNSSKPVSFQSLNLFCLPPEILEYILSFLDSYSLGQMSNTCMYFRNLCISFLKKRGIVTVNWEKFKRIDGSVTWQITGEKWLFSNAFAKVEKWCFSKHPPMSDHISKCPIAAKCVIKYDNSSKIKLLI